MGLSADLSTVKVILEFIKNFLLQVPIVTDGISSSEPQAFLQHHTALLECIATSVCMRNIQNIQTINSAIFGLLISAVILLLNYLVLILHLYIQFFSLDIIFST